MMTSTEEAGSGCIRYCLLWVSLLVRWNRQFLFYILMDSVSKFSLFIPIFTYIGSLGLYSVGLIYWAFEETGKKRTCMHKIKLKSHYDFPPLRIPFFSSIILFKIF